MNILMGVVVVWLFVLTVSHVYLSGHFKDVDFWATRRIHDLEAQTRAIMRHFKLKFVDKQLGVEGEE